jgi:hypothetical protein
MSLCTSTAELAFLNDFSRIVPRVASLRPIHPSLPFRVPGYAELLLELDND